MNEFVRKHEDRIHGVLSCFDRLLLRGYAWVEAVLRRLDYRQLKRADCAAAPVYLQRLSGYSRAQVTRLVSRWMNGRAMVKNHRKPEHAFTRRYTPADVALPAEVDRAMETLSGPATACVLRRQRDVFGDVFPATRCAQNDIA